MERVQELEGVIEEAGLDPEALIAAMAAAGADASSRGARVAAPEPLFELTDAPAELLIGGSALASSTGLHGCVCVRGTRQR